MDLGNYNEGLIDTTSIQEANSAQPINTNQRGDDRRWNSLRCSQSLMYQDLKAVLGLPLLIFSQIQQEKVVYFIK